MLLRRWSCSIRYVRVGHCQDPMCAVIAQLVERTLGKGEVASSILANSTIPFLLSPLTFKIC